MPAVKNGAGYILDFKFRYFTADFPYSLSVLVQIGDFLGLDISNMKEALAWYRKISGDEHDYSFAAYGIKSLNDFIEFYSA